MIEIPVLVATAWTALQPFLPVIATKAAEEIGKTAISKVWTAIEKKFDAKAGAKEALQDLVKYPQGAFRLQLKKLLEEDKSFASELSKLLESVGDDYKAQLAGSGAIAQGKNAKAVGAGGLMVEGGISGSTVVVGNNNSINARKKAKKK